MRARPRRAEPLVALFVAVTWAAAAFAIAGLLAVLLDRDPIETAVPRLYGVLALLLATLWVWVIVSVSAPSIRMPWPAALVAAAAVYFTFVLSGFVLGAPLLVELASSPFVIVAAGLAGVTVISTWVVIHLLRRDPRFH